MNLQNRCCGTCKHCKGYTCQQLKTELTDYHIEEFECDFYIRKNSGAFRRKLRKQKGENKE